MQRRTPIFIFCSSRPRVGKTLLARAMTEFYRSDERPVACFDVNPDEFALVEYLPGFTAVASVADTLGQIALFDQLLADSDAPRIIDLGHSQLDRFFTVIEQIGFAEEARRRGFVPVILFIADGDRRSKQGYGMLRSRFPRITLVPVINEAMPVASRYREDFPGTRSGGAPIDIPALSPMVKGLIERPSFSFTALTLAPQDSSSELASWTRRVFLEFRELELRLLLSELTLQPSA